MDIFVEQLVRKPADGKSTALKLLIVFGVVVVSLFCLYLTLIGIVIALLLIFAAIYGGFYLISGLNSEYEYIVTNGEIDIDKIIAQRKRKRLITAKPSKFEAFGKLADAAPVSGITVVEANGISKEEAEDYYIDFTHDSFGKVRLIFTPTERTIEAITPFLPRLVKMEYDKKYRS
ncbi:MAG: hypothetical protein ACI4I1_08440 [Oscillospiraceae bacterium]